MLRIMNAKDTPSYQSPKETKSGCLGGCLGVILGAVLGFVVAATWIYFNPSAITPEYLNSDGLNRYGGQMGLIMMGILFGGIIGGFIGADHTKSSRP